MLETPVVFIIFNRPETTMRVFDEIRRAKPKRLLIIADGPRLDHPKDAVKCLAARGVVDRIDWDCEIYRNYSEINLGCMQRVTSGLDWVFQLFEEAIILEDDCVPALSFFDFCSELLSKYKNDERIMTISGSNLLNDESKINHSYYFSNYQCPWGWATWKRAWQYFEPDMSFWPLIGNVEWLDNRLSDNISASYWLLVLNQLFEQIKLGQRNCWDYQWMTCLWVQNGLSVIPKVNLITNIGFDEEATNTKSYFETMSNIYSTDISFPLDHPKYVYPNTLLDAEYFIQLNPWANTPSGAYFWLRKTLLPYTPTKLRKYLSIIRRGFGFGC